MTLDGFTIQSIEHILDLVTSDAVAVSAAKGIFGGRNECRLEILHISS